MFGVHGEIVQYGWFCQAPGCDGYGGPVKEIMKKKAIVKTENENQLVLFE
jgi:hypothetical protein